MIKQVLRGYLRNKSGCYSKPPVSNLLFPSFDLFSQQSCKTLYCYQYKTCFTYMSSPKKRFNTCVLKQLYDRELNWLASFCYLTKDLLVFLALSCFMNQSRRIICQAEKKVPSRIFVRTGCSGLFSIELLLIHGNYILNKDILQTTDSCKSPL